MQNVASLFNHRFDDRYLGPAEVIAVDDDGSVELKISSKTADSVVCARSALPFRLHTGHQVLVINDGPSEFYIIGILNHGEDARPVEKRLVLPDGTIAIADGSVEQPILKIFSNDNRLMLEYDAVSGKILFTAPSAQIQVNASHGDIALTAAHTIRLEADRVDIVGRSEIGLRIGNVYERLKSMLAMRKGRLQFGAEILDMTAKRGEVNIEEVYSRSRQMTHRIDRIKTIAEKIETTAGLIIEKTKASYRSSEELTQVQAGRLRMLIDRALHIKSKHIVMKSEEDVKIKAEKINLG
jgi:hypothetical protein